MNKKILIIVILIVVVLGGIAVTSIILFNTNKVKNSLDGIYITETTSVPQNEYITHSYFDCMTFYENGLVSLVRVNMYDMKDVGTEVFKGETTTGSYTISNESKTILLSLGKANRTVSFDNNYKTLNENGNTYTLTNKTLDEIMPKNTYNDQRDTGFSGTYQYEIVKNESTDTYTSMYKGKKLLKIIERTVLSFANDGTFTSKGQYINVYADGTEEDLNATSLPSDERKYKYAYYKDNKEVVYYADRVFYSKYKLSDDLKTLTNSDGTEFKLVEN